MFENMMRRSANGIRGCGLFNGCATFFMAKESALKCLRIRQADDSYHCVGVFLLLPERVKKRVAIERLLEHSHW